MANDKYFYKLGMMISEWDQDTRIQFMNNLFPNIVHTADVLAPSEEDQFEEWNGLTDLDGKPFKRNRNLSIEDVSRNPAEKEDSSFFPLDTVDGDKISEKGFRRWVRREMKDYINALIENYEWKHGVEGKSLYDYVSRKGWVDFVNKFNPLRFLTVDLGQNVKKLSNEFEKQTGRSLKREYINVTKRLVNKKHKDSQPISVADQYQRLAFVKNRVDSLKLIKR